MPFVVTGLPLEPFAPLFDLDDAALLARGARRIVADRPDTYPCRISLRRARAGEEMLLVHHAHQPTPTSPYRAAGPVFVTRTPGPARVVGRVPDMMEGSLLSVRAYDRDAMIVDAEVVESGGLPAEIARLLGLPEVAYLHVHFARRGCYAARIDRA